MNKPRTADRSLHRFTTASSNDTSAKVAPGHVVIQKVRPSIDAGRYPAKRSVGQTLTVEATVFRDGHATLRTILKWRPKKGKSWAEISMTLVNRGLDLWQAKLPLTENTQIVYTVEAWTDDFSTWLADFRKRVAGGMKIASEAIEGAALLNQISKSANGKDRETLKRAAQLLRAESQDGNKALEAVMSPNLLEATDRAQPRLDTVVYDPPLELAVDRKRALFGAWYEMFPRSQGTEPGKASPLREAERRLPDIRNMGFDVLYLPPIHPIGKTKRKGRNNSLIAGPDDPGSPWAIGSEAGGHDAVEPALGTMKDFDHFVAAAREHELEIALDIALQCSPDHPWVKEHPDWFYQRPDGTIKYAENPPKKYEDIYPVNFDTRDRKGLWNEMRRMFQHWIDHGVRIFRVDNPHTKPTDFWEWLIGDIQERHPDVFFLAEAFTRPPMMTTLAKLGFGQSYTYFTWRNTKKELTEYVTELTATEMKEYFRPNFFTSTPDILPDILVHGGRPAFEMRLVLAATLSPTYGIYSGYELCENASIVHHAVGGEFEYADSEKYEIKVRNWDAPGNIKALIARVNTIRNENPALHELANLRFFRTDNDQILFYCKTTEDSSNVILVVVNLDPHRPHHGTAWVPLPELGASAGGAIEIEDLLTGARYTWSERNYVRLDPGTAHLFRVEKRT